MPDNTLDRFKTLAIKKNVLFSSLSETELGVLAFSASQCIDATASMSEKMFTHALTQWLATTGDMLHIDAVELRRTLVDLQFILRDPFGRDYRRNPTLPKRFAELCEQLADVDLTAVAYEAKEHERIRREQRRIAHAQK